MLLDTGVESPISCLIQWLCHLHLPQTLQSFSMSERSVAESPAGAMGEEVFGRLGLPAINGRCAVHRECHCALGSGAKSGSWMVCWPALGGCAGRPCGLRIHRRGATGVSLCHQNLLCLLAFLALWCIACRPFLPLVRTVYLTCSHPCAFQPLQPFLHLSGLRILQ